MGWGGVLQERKGVCRPLRTGHRGLAADNRGRQSTRSGLLSLGSRSQDWATGGAVVGSDTLARSPAQTSAMLTSYEFTSSFNLLFGRWSRRHEAGSRPWAAPYRAPSKVLRSCAQPCMASYRFGDMQSVGAVPRGHTRGSVWGSLWPVFGPFHLP